MSTPTTRSHAVVVGASIAGLLTARVLTDHFERVTIVERDHLPDGGAFRRGVPHSHHLHGLMPGGRLAVDSLLPGFTADMVDAGGTVVRWPEDALWLTPAGWSRRFEAAPDHRLVTIGRPLLESLVRRRVLALDRVSVLEGVDVAGLVPRPGGVAGIQLRDRGDRLGATLRRLDAELVVDASGRASRAPDWLDALGYGRPRETVIDALLGYASRQYEPPAGWRADWKGVYLMAQPPANARTGIMFPIEGGRWLLSMMGAAGDHPPTDEDGFMAFARSLRSPIIADAIRHARPVGDITGYRRTENRRRHYERMRRWPDGFAVVGDAACAFNPVYGSGMSVAARTAVALGEALSSGRGLRGFQRTVADRGAAAWLLATGEDLRYPTTVGSRATAGTRLLHRYLDRVMGAATVSPATNRAFVSVMTLMSPPDILFRPGVVLDALRHHDQLASAPTAAPVPLPIHAEVA